MADLVSRKPKADDHKDAPGAREAIALEYKPEPEEAHSASEVAEVAQPAEPLEMRVVDVAPEPPSDLEPAPDLVDTAPSIEDEACAVPGEVAEPTATPVVPVPVEPVEAPAKHAPSRANKIEPIVEPVVSVALSDGDAAARATGPKSILDEMRELDGDVAALRRQLATKLTEQNVQLRKMLARFDAR